MSRFMKLATIGVTTLAVTVTPLVSAQAAPLPALSSAQVATGGSIVDTVGWRRGYYGGGYGYGYRRSGIGGALFAGAALGLIGTAIAAAAAPRYRYYGYGYPAYGYGYRPAYYGYGYRPAYAYPAYGYSYYPYGY